MLGLQVADDGLDGSPSFHLAADDLRRSSYLAADPNPEPVRVIVPAIALVDRDAADFDPRQSFHIGDDRPERVAVERIAVQRLGVEHELAALGRGDRDLAPELIGCPGLTLADALN